MTTSAKARNIAINSGTFTKLAKRAVTGFVCMVLQKERVHRALEADMEVMRIIAEGGHVIVTGLNEKRLATAQTELGSAATVIKNDEGAAATSLYAATKRAVVAMARSWATALASRGIPVNVLVPGPIETNFRHFLPEDGKGLSDLLWIRCRSDARERLGKLRCRAVPSL